MVGNLPCGGSTDQKPISLLDVMNIDYNEKSDSVNELLRTEEYLSPGRTCVMENPPTKPDASGVLKTTEKQWNVTS